MAVRNFTDEMDVRFLRPDDPLVKTIARYNPRKVYGQLLSRMAWEVNYTGAAPPEPLDPDDPAWVTLPVGFISDGVTIYRWLWWFLPSWGHPIVRAALLHDYLLDRWRAGNPHPAYTTRPSLDGVFYEAAVALRTRRWMAAIAWAFIRAKSRLKGEG